MKKRCKEADIDFISMCVVRTSLAAQNALWQTAAEEYPEDVVRKAFAQASNALKLLEIDIDSFFKVSK